MAYPEMTCCVVEEGVRCRTSAGYATFDRRWLKNVSQKRQRYQADPEAGHNLVCERHRCVLNSMRAKRKRKDSEEDNDYQPEVDFLQLQMNTLRRYKRHYKLQLKSGSNKVQLVEAIAKHFKTIRVNEKKIVPLFITMVKSHKSKLDMPKPTDNSS